MKTRSAFLTVLMATLWWSSAVQAGDLYTLQGCYEKALQRSETLANQQEQIQLAEDHYQQAFGSILPAINGTAFYGWEDAYAPVSFPGRTLAFNPYQIKVTATQPLFRGLREYAALRQAGDLITAQKEAAHWAGIQLYMDVAQAFFNVLAYESDLYHYQVQDMLYSQRIEDLRARVRIGRSRRTEVLTVQSAQAALKAQVQQLQGQLAVAREVLTFLTGLEGTISLQEEESMPVQPAPEDHYLAGLDNRPDVKAARQQLASAKEGITIAKGGHWPSVDANGNYYFTRSDVASGGKWDATISLSLPLFMGGTIAAQTRSAEAQARISENNLNLVMRQDKQALHNAYINLKASLDQVAANQTASDLSQKNYQAVLKDYNLGLATNLDVLVAMSSDQDALRTLDRVRLSAKLNNILLEAAAMMRPIPAGGK